MYLHILYLDVVVSIAKYGIITHYMEGIADMSMNEQSRTVPNWASQYRCMLY